MTDRIVVGWRFLVALVCRERQAVMASRVSWSFGIGCLLWGLAGSPLFGIGRADTVVWFLLPVLLYAVPPVALLSGVVAWQGDAGEEELIQTRLPSPLTRLLAKWVTWTLLLELATLCMLIPLLPSAVDPSALLRIWLFAGGEISVFVAFGLVIGRFCKDPLLAYSSSLIIGFLMVAGGGLVAYVAAWQPMIQRFPDLWTLILMLHPVESLRVCLVYSVENLPFDARTLPPITSFWLQNSGLWYLGLSLTWSFVALLVTRFKPGKP
ncbi:hypothetical protein G0Q06_01465 [Puniceicoccales bacterium CK1056]|uniref:Uncharacterized protein n=1 Tax=Oceanipulchritudo coccoides TaxID=2706888 RepID=A0A6B2LX72_9BACT|nr:hypothetical protein [Oceanipulchritudo coccoides]NDV61111.1 hypothetical protein [Oceanipulchritudo coccoides]